jgi:hypothetical protein
VLSLEMILQKKQYLKSLNKRYKKLNNTLLGNSNLKSQITSNIKKDYQSINISLLTIDSINPKYKQDTDFPSVINVSTFSAFNNVDKAIIKYKGKTKLSKKFTSSLRENKRLTYAYHTLEDRAFAMQKRAKADNVTKQQPFLNLKELKLKDTENTVNVSNATNSLNGISQILGASIDMYHYKLCLTFFSEKQSHVPSTLTLGRHSWVGINQIRLSKVELSSIVVQLLHKIHSFKGASKNNSFNVKTLSNIIGAFIVVNSQIYFISGDELKQCCLAGDFKHSLSTFAANKIEGPTLLFNKSFPPVFTPPSGAKAQSSSSIKGINKDNKISLSLLNDLLDAKVNKTLFLNTKAMKPNITFFYYLNSTIRVMNDYKNILRWLVNTLEIYAFLKKTNQIKV